MKKIILSVFLGTMLAACGGYTALYKTDAPVMVADVTMINVEKNVGERRVAQTIKRELQRRFPSATASDKLFINIERTTGALAVREDAVTQRSNLTLTALVRLEDADGKTFWQAKMTKSSAFNVENTPLSTDVGRTYAGDTAAKALADDIGRRIYAVYSARGDIKE